MSNYTFQYRKRYELHAISQMYKKNNQNFMFQYRKRYELHAILFPGALGNSELKSRFSKTLSLFAIFPKPSGTFLSQNRLKRAFAASNIKETFVHEENLKLMAFFMIFCTSL